MALTKYKLGDLIYEITRQNSDLKYSVEYVRGISNTKEIMPTKADVDGSVIGKFYVIGNWSVAPNFPLENLQK